MAEGMEMMNMNFNMNATNVSALSLGGIDQGGTIAGSSQLQSMDKLATSLTTPGNNDGTSSVLAKLETLPKDNAAEFKAEAGKIGACNNYLEACNGKAEGQGQPISELKGDIAKAADKGVEFYAKEAKVADKNVKVADKAEKPVEAAPKRNTVAEKAIAGDQAADKAVNASKNGQVPAENVQAPQNNAVKNEQVASDDLKASAKQNMATSNNVKPADKSAADNAAKNATAKQQEIAKQETVRKENASKEAEVKANEKKEVAKKEEATEELNAEVNAKVGSEIKESKNNMFASSDDMSSVLTQYLEQNTSLNSAQINTLVEDYSSQVVTDDMSTVFSNLDKDASKMVDGTYSSANYNVADNGIGRNFNNRLDFVGTTAMSANMANLEQLVNMDLMANFASGENMQGGE